jgi:hypothetical protein
MNIGFRFPGWRLPNTTDPVAVARGGDETRTAAGALAPAGDSGGTTPETNAS